MVAEVKGVAGYSHGNGDVLVRRVFRGAEFHQETIVGTVTVIITMCMTAGIGVAGTLSRGGSSLSGVRGSSEIAVNLCSGHNRQRYCNEQAGEQGMFASGEHGVTVNRWVGVSASGSDTRHRICRVSMPASLI